MISVFGWPDPNMGFNQSKHALYTCYFINIFLLQLSYCFIKFQTPLVLMECVLWGFTQEGKGQPAHETTMDAAKRSLELWLDKAYLLIALNVEKHLQIHIFGTIELLKAWQNLQKQFEFASVTQIVRLNPKFYAASMQEGLMKHLTYMMSPAEQLRKLKEDISSKKFDTVILGSLPYSYDNFANQFEWGFCFQFVLFYLVPHFLCLFQDNDWPEDS